MVKKLALFTICFAYLSGIAIAQDAKTVIANAQKALGDPKSVTYSGSAQDVAFQQCGANLTADELPGDAQSDAPDHQLRPRHRSHRAGVASRVGRRTTSGPVARRRSRPGTFFQQVTPQQADLAQPWGDSVEFYITPWGFLKGAAANNARASRRPYDGKTYTVLTWSPTVKAPSGKAYTINGYVNDSNQVERVETWLNDNIMGDMHIVATYTGWKDFGGAMAPARIAQTRGGWPFFVVDVTSARLNPSDVATLVPAPAPPAGRGGGPPPGGAPGGPPAMTVTAEKLGDGLYRLTTGAGSYDSILVEFRDYVMMLEAGQPEARGALYIAETKKLFPKKPLRYVWNSHPHSDHTGGLPALVAEGVTIITQQNNKDFFEQALNTPRTLLNDTLAKNPKKVKIETIAAKKVYSDGTRTVEFHHIYPSPHSNGLTIAFIPKEKILFQADYTLPAAGQQPNDHIKALQPIVEKLNLDFEQYIPVHRGAAPLTKADLWKAMGK